MGISREEFIKKYEELLDKGYCNCNEMNCIDNNTPRKLLETIKELQQENQKYKEVIDKARVLAHGHIDGFSSINEYGTCNDILEVVYQFKEILDGNIKND